MGTRWYHPLSSPALTPPTPWAGFHGVVVVDRPRCGGRGRRIERAAESSGVAGQRLDCGLPLKERARIDGSGHAVAIVTGKRDLRECLGLCRLCNRKDQHCTGNEKNSY